MSNNTLVIVEGNDAENKYCKSIASAYGLNLEIYCLGTNIYSLYRKLEEYDFNADVKQVLKEIHPEYQDILSNEFAYTYLFFDLDPHHPKREETRSLKEIVSDNIQKARKMAEYFNDETDPTSGKLYINYPMWESFRDCDTPFDPYYIDEYVKIENIIAFKTYVSKKKMNRKHMNKYTKDDFNQLIKMNVYKLNAFFFQKWEDMEYGQYRESSDTKKILEKQKAVIDAEEKVAVLNTSLFFVLDYFGNQNRFYDRVMQS